MSVPAVAHFVLPDTPYALWAEGSLSEHLRIPADGTRIEIVNGEIVVSPAPAVGHNGIVSDVQECLTIAKHTRPSFPWSCIQSTDVNLPPVQEGYVPDLVVLRSEVLRKARQADLRHLQAEQVDLVVEVTSPSNAQYDRAPALRRPDTKWTGYARVGIPYYLLIDRAPQTAQARLYSAPNMGSGVYLDCMTWEFGDKIRLPEPFGVEIPTDDWEPWA